MKELDISTESWRKYHYADESTFTIDSPARLYLKQDDNGDSHRIVNQMGYTYYPRRGWIAISWYAPDVPVSF